MTYTTQAFIAAGFGAGVIAAGAVLTVACVAIYCWLNRDSI